jgi:hypothetical protein|tara:strand:+ start:461 stop:637 length:177 start_codon:yes stop_codon:yes gene_type:complete
MGFFRSSALGMFVEKTLGALLNLRTCRRGIQTLGDALNTACPAEYNPGSYLSTTFFSF